MTFAFAITNRDIFGTRKIIYGTFTNGAEDVGGDVTLTGELHQVDFFWVQATGSTPGNQPIIDEAFPCGDTVTIATDAGQDGIWMAWGR